MEDTNSSFEKLAASYVSSLNKVSLFKAFMICWKCAILKINIHLFNCKNHFKKPEQQTLEHEDTNNVKDHVSINEEVLDERDDEHDDECDDERDNDDDGVDGDDGPLLDIEEVSESSLGCSVK